MRELSLNNIAWSPAGNNSMLEGIIERMIADHMRELSLNNIAWSPAGNNSMLEGMYREDDSRSYEGT